jgi:hypothetical protein
MKNSIYEIYVPVTSQEQADRLKAICLEYGLPIPEKQYYFNICSDVSNFAYWGNQFAVWDDYCIGQPPITESEFLLLAKEFKQ